MAMNSLKSGGWVVSNLWLRGKWAAPAIMLLSAGLLLAQDAPAPVPDQAVAEPSTPEHMPARPPRVSTAGGMLTIEADNSTIADILNKVHEVTGATIEIPPSAGTERVVVHIGPAPARDVLSTLLYGMPFNYVIEGSDTNPLDVQSVVLTPRTAGTATASNRASPAPAVMSRMAYNPPPEPSSDEEGNAKQAARPVENEASLASRGGINMSNEERVAAQAAAAAEAMAAVGTAPPAPNSSDGSTGTDANGNPPKVNDQISNTLFHMFQQRAQMQAQENQQRQQPQTPPPPQN